MKKMVDPPSGWKYGFPKEMPADVDNMDEWLVSEGYPREEIQRMGEHFFVRMWAEE